MKMVLDLILAAFGPIFVPTIYFRTITIDPGWMIAMDACYEKAFFATRSHNFYSESMMYVGENSLALGHRGNYSAYKLYHGRLHEPVLPIYNHFLLKMNSVCTISRLPIIQCSFILSVIQQWKHTGGCQVIHVSFSLFYR